MSAVSYGGGIAAFVETGLLYDKVYALVGGRRIDVAPRSIGTYSPSVSGAGLVAYVVKVGGAKFELRVWSPADGNKTLLRSKQPLMSHSWRNANSVAVLEQTDGGIGIVVVATNGRVPPLRISTSRPNARIVDAFGSEFLLQDYFDAANSALVLIDARGRARRKLPQRQVLARLEGGFLMAGGDSQLFQVTGPALVDVVAVGPRADSVVYRGFLL